TISGGPPSWSWATSPRIRSLRTTSAPAPSTSPSSPTGQLRTDGRGARGDQFESRIVRIDKQSQCSARLLLGALYPSIRLCIATRLELSRSGLAPTSRRPALPVGRELVNNRGQDTLIAW